jgi:glutamyl-tRNA synthetase
MLALLGWNPGTEQEIFSMDELIKNFSFEHVHKAGARFDPEKAKWFNAQYLHVKPDAELAERFKPVVRKTFQIINGDRRQDNTFLIPAVKLLKERVQFENEMAEKGKYLFITPTVLDDMVVAKKWKPSFADFFEKMITAFSSMKGFKAADIDAKFKETAAANNLKPGEVLQLFRIILTGQSSGVDLFPMSELLGKSEVCSRIKAGLNMILIKTNS